MRTTLHALQKNKTQKWPTAVVNDQNCTFLIFCETVTRNDLGGKNINSQLVQKPTHFELNLPRTVS
jgi:hypothetical protein